jgi:hypothetical protein
VELNEPIIFNSGQKYWITIYGYEDYFPQSIVAVHDESHGGIKLNECNIKSQYWYNLGNYPSSDWFNVSEYEEIYDMNFLLLDYPVNNPPNNPTYQYDGDNDVIIVSTTDLDDDKLKYGVSWDNDNTVDEWTNFVESGTEVNLDCEGREGPVGVIAEDEFGAQSDWISVESKTKELNLIQLWLQRLVERFPFLDSLLNY